MARVDLNLTPECRVHQFGIPTEVIRNMDPALLPEKLTISLDQPDIRLLPDKVAGRIEDMWRVGAMLAGFHKLSHAAKERKELVGDACNLGWRAALQSPLTVEGAKELEQAVEAIRARNSAIERDSPETMASVRNGARVTFAQGHRLGYEAELLFFHSALDYLPEADRTEIEQLPLIHCLKRLRNVVTHFRQAEVKVGDFRATSSDSPESDRAPVHFHFIGSWFLVVDPADMLRTRGGQCHENLFVWFKGICEKHPMWWVLHAAVQHLCDYYRNQR